MTQKKSKFVNGHTLQFPRELTEEVGLNVNQINALKKKGCRFYGRKTCLAWVLEYLEETTAKESSSAPPEHPPRLSDYKFGGLEN